MENSRILDIVANFADKKIIVVGDLMLDVYLWGRVSRISPEAPVPIVETLRTNSCLGGAANVMRNIVTLGGKAFAFGVVGEDNNGRELCCQLENYGIKSGSVAVDSLRRTTTKQRVIGGQQQLLRIDYEDTFPVMEDVRNKMCEEIITMIKSGDVHAVVFEDYAKGMLSWQMLERIVPVANANGVFTALDPKPNSFAPVRDLSMIKPNKKEAYELAGIRERQGALNTEELDKVAGIIRERWNPRYLLISLAADGLAIYDETGKCHIIPTSAREVFDVSGAGDTVVAAFTLSICAGASPVEAAVIGNLAAGVVVGKVGTVTVSSDELKEQLR